MIVDPDDGAGTCPVANVAPCRRLSPEESRAVRSIPIGRVFGVRLGVHWTVLVIFALIVLQVRGEVLPTWHPDWTSATSWAVALAAAIVFLASIVIHELAHAMVARAYGIPVRSITLFLLGGVADIERRPPHPRAEALMAAVGPLTSALLGIAAIVVSASLAPAMATDDPMEAIAAFGPVATVLAWVGPVNLVLAAFNTIPAFPLDGGRVFRALLWWLTRDALRATRVAALVSRGLAVAMFATGVVMGFGVDVPLFGTGIGSGLWLALLGWFLYSVATLSYQQLLVETMLAPMKVRDVMHEAPPTVAAASTLAELAEQFFRRTEDHALPVVTDGALVGQVTTDDLRRFPRAEWPERHVQDVMTPAAQVESLSPDDALVDGLRRLGRDDARELPVIEDHALVGVLRQRDVSRWIELRADPTLAHVA